jgi:putative NADH-flavin reductase
MKFFVLGATGHTGEHILDIALARSHEVTAFVRSPQKVVRRDPRLRVVPGNPLDVDQVAEHLEGQDAVLSALGVRPPQAFRPHSVVEECAASTVAAMTRTRVNRLVLVSAAVLFPMKGIQFAFFRWLLQHISRDLSTAEEIVQATTLDWTIVRPPRLTNGHDVRYRLTQNALPSKGNVASFRAVAAFMVDAAEQNSHIRELVGLAS